MFELGLAAVILGCLIVLMWFYPRVRRSSRPSYRYPRGTATLSARPYASTTASRRRRDDGFGPMELDAEHSPVPGRVQRRAGDDAYDEEPLRSPAAAQPVGGAQTDSRSAPPRAAPVDYASDGDSGGGDVDGD